MMAKTQWRTQKNECKKAIPTLRNLLTKWRMGAWLAYRKEISDPTDKIQQPEIYRYLIIPNVKLHK